LTAKKEYFSFENLSDIPALKKHSFPLFIDDGEPSIHLAVKTQAPNLVQFELWIHRFRDIDHHFRQKGNFYDYKPIHVCLFFVCHGMQEKNRGIAKGL